MSMFKWDVVDPAPGEAVLPHQRLPWGKTIGLGAQHVVAMFGATFVFPLVMGLDANLAIMFSGLCTILFLLIVQNRVPSYLGTSASFVASVAAIRALDEGNDSSYVTGAILVGGLVLVLTAPKSPSREKATVTGSIHAVPQVATNGAGLSIQGILP